jgi:chromosome segregation ATPase
MFLTREQRDNRKYTLHNSDTSTRQVVIEHPTRDGWKLAEGAKPEETSASFLRFRVAVGPGQTENLQVEEYHPEQSEYELDELDDNRIAILTQQAPITPEVQEVFRRVLAQKNQVGSLETQLRSRQQEVDTITKDQARLRENMKALKGSSEEKALLQRYTRQLDSQEDRLNTLNKEMSDLRAKRAVEQEKLDRMLQEITLDQNL